MNRVLLARALAANRVRLLACAIGIIAWGMILPVIYATFGKELAGIIQGNPFLSQFSQFGGGDIFTLSGSIALGFIHPFSVALLSVFAIGYSVAAVAGERQRGTLEVLLARPISRRSLYVTSFVAGALFVGVLLALELAANVLSASLLGVVDELEVANVPAVWLNGWLLFLAFMAIGLAASVSFDRLAPALGVTLVVLLLMYVLDVVASFWPDAAWLADYSLFHYVKAKQILEGTLAIGDFGLLAAVVAIAVAVALFVFPRRDIAAPS
jgi:ABC-2 type transport system permease protein